MNFRLHLILISHFRLQLAKGSIPTINIENEPSTSKVPQQTDRKRRVDRRMVHKLIDGELFVMTVTKLNNVISNSMLLNLRCTCCRSL